MTAAALPKQSPANDKLIASTPFAQLTERQKQYAAINHVTLQQPVAPNPRNVNGPNAPGGTSYVGSPENTGPQVVPPGYTPPVAATPAAVTTPVDDTAAQQARANALELLTQQFVNFGLFDGPNDPRLPAFRNQISSWLVQGFTANTISLLLQDNEVYKQRFAGNEARKANGLAVLPPDQYLSLERAYKQVFSSYGLPNGFYDSPAHLADMIGRDVSASEVNDRVAAAYSFVHSADPAKRQELALYYPELTTGDLIANFLDPKQAKPLLDKKVAATAIGYQAARQGLASPDRGVAEKYADLGVTETQAQNAYSNIAEILPTEQAIGQRFGDQYSQSDAEDEMLGGLASAKRKRDRLNQQEQGLFSGSGAVGRGSLAAPPGTY